MSHRDRFRLKSQLTAELESEAWPISKINLLFSELDMEQIGDDWHGPGIPDVIADLSDGELNELYSIVLDIDQEEVEDAVEATENHGNWRQGHIRLFMSHSARHKKFVGQVANELAVFGIHGFVAHDTMQVSKSWQKQIEHHLRSMEVFVAILHPEFKSSAWCHQEVGWALGRRVPLFAIRMGDDPAGFIASDQWDSGHGLDAKDLAKLIYRRVAEIPGLGPSIIDGLFTALENAADYFSAGAAASRVAELKTISDEDFARLDAIWWRNDQLYTGTLPTKAMQPFYRDNGREWPPPKP